MTIRNLSLRPRYGGVARRLRPRPSGLPSTAAMRKQLEYLGLQWVGCIRGVLAGRPRASPHDSAQARSSRQDGRSRPAGGVQQPLHVDCRADGRGAEQHGAVRQYQGAARLLVRRFRRQGRTGRQRAAYADPPGQHGPLGRDRDPPQRGQAQARRRAYAERALQRRHAPARHHRHHAGVRRRPARRSCSMWPAAATRRTSAAWRQAP